MKITKCKYGIEEWCCKKAKKYIHTPNEYISTCFIVGWINTHEEINFCPFCGEKITIES